MIADIYIVLYHNFLCYIVVSCIVMSYVLSYIVAASQRLTSADKVMVSVMMKKKVVDIDKVTGVLLFCIRLQNNY